MQQSEGTAAPQNLPAAGSLETLLARREAFLSFVERRVGDRALAEDLLQSAYMRAFERAGRPAEADAALSWFYAVLRHAVIDFYRRRATEVKVLSGWDDAAADTAAAPVPSHRFVCGCIERVLPGMKPAYAEVLREVDLGEGSLAAFAERHGVTPGNAAVRAHRARAALRRSLQAFCGACSFDACMDCVCKEDDE